MQSMANRKIFYVNFLHTIRPQSVCAICTPHLFMSVISNVFCMFITSAPLSAGIAIRRVCCLVGWFIRPLVCIRASAVMAGERVWQRCVCLAEVAPTTAFSSFVFKDDLPHYGT